MSLVSDRIIAIQIFKNDQWTDLCHTFDEPNVIMRVISILKFQHKEAELRLIDTYGSPIDMTPYNQPQRTNFKFRGMNAFSK